MRRILKVAVVLMFFASQLISQVELGAVKWGRDYEQAKVESEKSGKPMLILFQEVPGCITCRNYGKNVLSDPLLVEVIEDNFTPVAVYNNKGGEDAKVLKSFGEPSWNNPVMRIITSKGKSIRNSGKYDAISTIDFVIKGMLKNNKLIPTYLSNLRSEYTAMSGKEEELTLGMYCFWSGEKELGRIDGVTSTSAGWMKGKEVVKVTYNPEIVTAKKLIKKARKKQMAKQVFTDRIDVVDKEKQSVGKYTLDKDQKYYLKQSKYSRLEMSDYQSMLVNSAIGSRANVEDLLSPRQLQLVGQAR